MARSWGVRFAAGVAAGLAGVELIRRLRADDLRGEVAVVAGGSRSLGLYIARELADAGCKLVIGARNPVELADAQEELERRGAEVLVRRCDVANRDEVTALVSAAQERFGQIDIVVNVAGLIQVGPIESMTLETFRDAMAVNFWGPMHVIDAVLPQMRARRHGRIVNITSIGGTIPVPHLVPYDAAKAGAIALSEGLGAELGKDGITVTTVIPGLMRTGSVPYAYFKGETEREHAWFRFLATSRLTAMSPARAARRIVEAVRQRRGRVVLTASAKLGRIAYALFPGLVRTLFAGANRLLSSGPADENRRERRGAELNPLPGTPPG